MKKNNYIYFLLFISVLLQTFFYNNTNLHYQYTFAIGITGLDIKLNISPMLPLLFPILLLVFAFNDKIATLINKSGKIYVIRNYSKFYLINKTIISIIIRIIIFVCIQIAVYNIFQGKLERAPLTINVKTILLYTNVVLAIALFEQAMQFFLHPIYVALTASIYIFIGNTFGILTKSMFLKFVFFPSLTFGLYNGSMNDPKKYLINFIFTVTLNKFLYLFIFV